MGPGESSPSPPPPPPHTHTHTHTISPLHLTLQASKYCADAKDYLEMMCRDCQAELNQFDLQKETGIEADSHGVCSQAVGETREGEPSLPPQPS